MKAMKVGRRIKLIRLIGFRPLIDPNHVALLAIANHRMQARAGPGLGFSNPIFHQSRADTVCDWCATCFAPPARFWISERHSPACRRTFQRAYILAPEVPSLSV
jgi:hypothetical protein